MVLAPRPGGFNTPSAGIHLAGTWQGQGQGSTQHCLSTASLKTLHHGTRALLLRCYNNLDLACSKTCNAATKLSQVLPSRVVLLWALRTGLCVCTVRTAISLFSKAIGPSLGPAVPNCSNCSSFRSRLLHFISFPLCTDICVSLPCYIIITPNTEHSHHQEKREKGKRETPLLQTNKRSGAVWEKDRNKIRGPFKPAASPMHHEDRTSPPLPSHNPSITPC